MVKYVLTALAKQDLWGIGQFTQNRWGTVQRDRYLDALVAAFEKLSDEQILGRPRDGLKMGLLSYQSHSHVIYFRRTLRGVEVLRILHQRMDAKSKF